MSCVIGLEDAKAEWEACMVLENFRPAASRLLKGKLSPHTRASKTKQLARHNQASIPPSACGIVESPICWVGSAFFYSTLTLLPYCRRKAFILLGGRHFCGAD